MKNAMRTYRLRSAFTLIEVLVVIVIVSMLATMAIPRFKTVFRSNQLRTSARDIVSLMRLARAEAITQRSIVYLRFDLDSHVYRLDLNLDGISARERQEGRGYLDPSEQIRELPETVLFNNIVTFDEYTLVGDQIVELRFFPRGTATGAIILLQTHHEDEKNAKYMTVELFRTTGNVEVYEGQPKDSSVQRLKKKKERDEEPSEYL